MKDLSEYVFICDNEEDYRNGLEVLKLITGQGAQASHYEIWPHLTITNRNNNIIICGCKPEYKPEMKRVNIKELFILDIYDFL